MLDVDITRKNGYARLVSARDYITGENTLLTQLKIFLMDCQNEGKSPHTLIGYEMAVRLFCNFLTENGLSLEPSQIKTDYIRFYLHSLRERNLSSDTVGDYFRTLKCFFNWCIRQNIITNNPTANIRHPHKEDKDRRIFTLEEIGRILKVLDTNYFPDIRNTAIVLIFLDTGMRLAENAGIALNDIDLQSGLIRITGKGRKQRQVRIGLYTRKMLLRYLNARRDSKDLNLWLTEERKPLAIEGMQGAMIRVIKRAGIEGDKLAPHTFRHTAAANLLRNGCNLVVLQNILGHSRIETTRLYLKSIGIEDLIREHEKASPIDNLFGKGGHRV